jgi:hypothetical protein
LKINNKKKILEIITEPLKKFYNCSKPLQPIDMIGVVKNGKVLCVECGIMTEYRDYNMSSYGPVCMRHISDGIMRHHPVYLQEELNPAVPEPKKRLPHRRLIIPECERGGCCQICGETRASLNLIVYNVIDFKLTLRMSCRMCFYTLTKNRQGKSHILSSNDVSEYRSSKGYL